MICDYRNEECSGQGIQIGNRWVCHNHLKNVSESEKIDAAMNIIFGRHTKQPPRQVAEPDVDVFIHWMCAGLARVSEGVEILDQIGKAAYQQLSQPSRIDTDVLERSLERFLLILNQYHALVID